MNCKVIKKVATPPFLHEPPHFSGLSPFLAKIFDPLPQPQVTQILEGPTNSPPPL